MSIPSFDSPVVIHWFRRDLRWQDNRALHAALTSGLPVVPMFVFDKNILERLDNTADARVTFLHNRISQLHKEAGEHGGALFVTHGDPVEVLAALAASGQVRAVYTNEDYEPYAQTRDAQVQADLGQHGVAFHTFTDHVIQAPGEVMKPDGTPYTVFTPFSKRWHLNLTEENMASAPSESHLESLHHWTASAVPSLEFMGFERSSIAAPEAVLSNDVLAKYADLRDVPSVQGTSRLSVHLRFGTMSIREAAKAGFKHSEKWLTELIWRDFYQAIMHAFPHSMTDAFRPQYDKVPWRYDDVGFKKWQQGQTGYPLVDAGMRELLATGFMHNRVRKYDLGTGAVTTVAGQSSSGSTDGIGTSYAAAAKFNLPSCIEIHPDGNYALIVDKVHSMGCLWTVMIQKNLRPHLLVHLFYLEAHFGSMTTLD